MDRENKKNIPLPLIILCLIIVFFSILIYSSSYFQSKLQEINYSEQETGYRSTKQLNTITFGVDHKRDSVRYLTQLSISLSDVLKADSVIKPLTPEQCLRELDSGEIDIAVLADLNFVPDYQRYNYSDSSINSDYIILTKKTNKLLHNDVNFALSGLLIRGRIWDLKQQYLIQ